MSQRLAVAVDSVSEPPCPHVLPHSPPPLLQKLHEELKHHLERLNGVYIASQVNEVAMYVKFKGEYVQQVKDWLRERGL